MLPEKTRIAIGERIREGRRKLQMTQETFSEMVDISKNYLSEIETGKKGFSGETLYKLVQNMDVTADYILFGTENDKSRIDMIIESIPTLDEQNARLASVYLDSYIKMKFKD